MMNVDLMANAFETSINRDMPDFKNVSIFNYNMDNKANRLDTYEYSKVSLFGCDTLLVIRS